MESNIKEVNNTLRQLVVDNKEMEKQLLQADNEKLRLKEEIKKHQRRGKQPSFVESKEKKDKREQRLCGQSFEGSVDALTDNSSFVGCDMFIPEDDPDHEPNFGGQSPQTYGTKNLDQAKTGYNKKDNPDLLGVSLDTTQTY